ARGWLDAGAGGRELRLDSRPAPATGRYATARRAEVRQEVRLGGDCFSRGRFRVGRALRSPLAQLVHDPLRVPSYAGDRVRSHRVQEVQAEEVEAGLAGHDTLVMRGLL